MGRAVVPPFQDVISCRFPKLVPEKIELAIFNFQVTCSQSPCRGWRTSRRFLSPAGGTHWCKESLDSPAREILIYTRLASYVPHVLHEDGQPHNFCWPSTRRTPIWWCDGWSRQPFHFGDYRPGRKSPLWCHSASPGISLQPDACGICKLTEVKVV